MERSDECFDVCLQLLDLNCVRGADFLEFRDLPSEPLLVIRALAPGSDLVVELVFEVGVPLGEGIARDTGFGGQSDDGPGPGFPAPATRRLPGTWGQ
ncbi:hypothetical protein ABTY00_27535 [Streptomyces microflavus]|uniref:hypothetical protein n=1 Tax=Streptomyces microflavus TaxID=1919 RepID=UPI0033180AA2